MQACWLSTDALPLECRQGSEHVRLCSPVPWMKACSQTTALLMEPREIDELPVPWVAYLSLYISAHLPLIIFLFIISTPQLSNVIDHSWKISLIPKWPRSILSCCFLFHFPTPGVRIIKMSHASGGKKKKNTAQRAYKWNVNICQRKEGRNWVFRFLFKTEEAKPNLKYEVLKKDRNLCESEASKELATEEKRK